MSCGNEELHNLMHRLYQFDVCCTRARQLFQSKNKEYGDAIATTGVLGAIVEVITVAKRLQQLLKDPKSFDSPENQPWVKEVFDKMFDLHNYANIVQMMISDENWTGEWINDEE